MGRGAINRTRKSILLNRATRALAGARIGTRALAAQRQATAMTQAAVGAQIDQTLDAHADFATQIAFDRELLHFGTNLLDFGLGQRLDLGRRVHARRGTDQLRPRAADTENTLQSDHN